MPKKRAMIEAFTMKTSGRRLGGMKEPYPGYWDDQRKKFDEGYGMSTRAKIGAVVAFLVWMGFLAWVFWVL